MAGEMKIEMWPIGKVLPYTNNAKIHDEKQVAKIAESIKQSGFDQPIVVDKRGYIIKGHGRRMACLKLGITSVPVIVRSDLTEDQVKAARLADNRVATGDMDSKLLQAELAAINLNMDGIFDKKELDFLEADLTMMNAESVIVDIDAAVLEHNAETKQSVEDAGNRDVRIDKVLGFKSVKGKHERAVVRFMANLEEQYGMPPEDSFVKFINDLTA